MVTITVERECNSIHCNSDYCAIGSIYCDGSIGTDIRYRAICEYD
jgi:hypothetical protein